MLTLRLVCSVCCLQTHPKTPSLPLKQYSGVTTAFLNYDTFSVIGVGSDKEGA